MISGRGIYLIALLQKHLVIFTQSNTEDNRSDILKTVNPLFALTALAAYVKHTIYRISRIRGAVWLCARTGCSIGPLWIVFRKYRLSSYALVGHLKHWGCSRMMLFASPLRRSWLQVRICVMGKSKKEKRKKATKYSLWCGVHQIELILTLQNCWCTRVIPQICDSIPHFRVKRSIGVRIDMVFLQEVDVVLNLLAWWF